MAGMLKVHPGMKSRPFAFPVPQKGAEHADTKQGEMLAGWVRPKQMVLSICSAATDLQSLFFSLRPFLTLLGEQTTAREWRPQDTASAGSGKPFSFETLLLFTAPYSKLAVPQASVGPLVLALPSHCKSAELTNVRATTLPTGASSGSLSIFC